MDQSRRAVEAYWRSKMVDAVTADEDKVAAIYRIEELCELLRTSDASIVKELSGYVLKRLEHKSPIVKQKALRVIKYSVGKAGIEFRREMQRHSAAVRQLVHYRGQPDPLKGDALNKAVRDTANEAVAAIFATDDTKTAAPAENLGKRIEGFGNTNYEPPKEEKKSFLSEVVDIGTASIKHGLTTFAAAHTALKNDNGTYKSPTLNRSLTTESNRRDRYGSGGNHYGSLGASKNAASGSWVQDSGTAVPSSVVNDDAGSSKSGIKSREEKLLETIVTSSGVRLQPTRDALHVFLLEASKLDALAMSHALETKLQSPIWQVRMKAVCVLESIVRRKDDEPFNIITSYFSENAESLLKCTELPQVSLSEKANKVLNLLIGEQSAKANHVGNSDVKPAEGPVAPMPDLIDTGYLSNAESEQSSLERNDQFVGNLASSSSTIDDLFGSQPAVDSEGGDPFADVSFHAAGGQQPKDNDLFSGLTVGDNASDNTTNIPSASKTENLDIFGANSVAVNQVSSGKSVNDLMSEISLSGMPEGHSEAASGGFNIYNLTGQPNQTPNASSSNGVLGQNAYYPQIPVNYSAAPQMLFNQAYAGQQVNYGAMGAFIAQQQLLHNYGNYKPGLGNSSYNSMDNGNGSALPDIFNLNNPVQSHVTVISNTKKEDTKAFDFVSDHLAAARGSKKVA